MRDRIGEYVARQCERSITAQLLSVQPDDDSAAMPFQPVRGVEIPAHLVVVQLAAAALVVAVVVAVAVVVVAVTSVVPVLSTI